jgi:hypothetical protein
MHLGCRRCVRGQSLLSRLAGSCVFACRCRDAWALRCVLNRKLRRRLFLRSVCHHPARNCALAQPVAFHFQATVGFSSRWHLRRQDLGWTDSIVGVASRPDRGAQRRCSGSLCVFVINKCRSGAAFDPAYVVLVNSHARLSSSCRRVSRVKRGPPSPLAER